MCKIRIGIYQMKVTDNKNYNIEKAIKGIEEAEKRGCELTILPEMFNCPYDHDYFKKFAEDDNNCHTLRKLIIAAIKNNMLIVAGSIPERDGNIIYNTSYTISNKGEVINKYRKVHLFDIDIKNKIKFIESDTLKAGNAISVFNTKYGKIGVAICYDIRFPEIFIKMSEAGAKIFIIPGAFNTITGPAHWALLARARALDNQAYVVMASPALNNESTYLAYGHSLIADPWGTIICEAGHNEELIDCEIDLDYLELIRTELPILKHKRRDLY